MTSLYSSNFIQGDKGNSIQQGQDVVIKIDGNPNYIIGQLIQYHLGRRKLIQIEQTGTMQNPEKDRVTFEMVKKKGRKYSPMKTGKFRVVIYAYISGVGGKKWTDDFEVI